MHAELMWVRTEQLLAKKRNEFSDIYQSLNLKYDSDGVLRLHGRLPNALVEIDIKHPVYLRTDSTFTKLLKLILQAHEKTGHAGINSTLNEIRSRYWFSRGRKRILSIIKHCVIRKKAQGKTMKGSETPILPDYRLYSDFAFANTGVDFAGPFYIKNIYSDTNTLHKAYLLLFTCAVTRNVHLELTPSMGVPSVICALKQFFARRGYVKKFISDNFSTFKSSELSKFLRDKLINWKFILPLSPWWEGFYERLIRIIKGTLRKTLGKARLTFDQLNTELAKVEMIVNSRPLCYVSDEHDVEPLTPSHLTVGRRLLSQAGLVDTEDPDLIEINALERFEHLKTSIEYFKTRFYKEYLNELQEHHVYNRRKYDVINNIQNNGMVLIKDDNKLPRSCWKKCVVIDKITGSDGKVRGAVLRVIGKDGIAVKLKRDLKRLVPLELQPSCGPPIDLPEKRVSAKTAELKMKLTNQ